MKHQLIKLKNLLHGPEKDLGGPDLARGPPFAHPWFTLILPAHRVEHTV